MPRDTAYLPTFYVHSGYCLLPAFHVADSVLTLHLEGHRAPLLQREHRLSHFAVATRLTHQGDFQ